jgi:hypothetical protein
MAYADDVVIMRRRLQDVKVFTLRVNKKKIIIIIIRWYYKFNKKL